MVALESDSELARGDEAPAFELPGVDGRTHALTDYDDCDALLVVFTCNHCPYAQAKFDELNHLADAYDGLAVVGINPNDENEYPEDSFEKMREYVERGEIDFDAYLRDESQDVARAYGAVCTPDPFLFRHERTTRGDNGATESERGDGGSFRLAYHGRLDDALNPDEEPTTFHARTAVEAVLAGEDVELEDMPSRGCSIKWQE